MSGTRRRLPEACGALLWVGVLVGCSPTLGNAPVLEAPNPTSPSNAPQIGSVADVFGHGDQDAERLAEHYCMNGDGLFGPPTGKPYPKFEDWDYQPGDSLSSCDQIDRAVLQTWEAKAASMSLVQIEAIVEDAEGNGVGLVGFQEWLTIRTPGVVSDYLVTDHEENQSEEAAEVYMEIELETVAFKDVVGGLAPDFVAIRSVAIGDCYECDFCYSQEKVATFLIICGDHATNPGCIELPLTWTETTTPRNDASDCDETVGPDEGPETWGFAVNFLVPSKGVLVIDSATPGSSLDRVPGVELPSLGRFDLNELFSAAEE